MVEDPLAYRADLAAGLRVGSRVAGYRLEKQIGAGGMAVVYRAQDERLGRPVALKIMAPAMAADEMFRRRFIRESRAAAAVDDPHIIPVYEAGEAHGVLFIAIRFVSGGDVGALLHREGPLPPARAASIISAVASALDAAHAAGLVHRDVKPTNMLLDTRPGRPDHVYLSDFGLSKGEQSGRLTASGQFVGTPNYTSPEQIDGQAVDGRTDQYALACAAFELLAGHVPFADSEGWGTVWAHLKKPPPALTHHRPDLSRAVDQVFAKALAKSPLDRYSSCWQFADALREALGLAPYHLGSGAAPEAGRPGTGEARPSHRGRDEAGLPDRDAAAAPVGVITVPPRAAAGLARDPRVSRPAPVTGDGAPLPPANRGGRGRRVRPPRRSHRLPITLAATAILAGAVAAGYVALNPASTAGPALFTRIHTFTAPRPVGLWPFVSSVAFSPDGKTLATGLTTETPFGPDNSGATSLWDLVTGKPVAPLESSGGAEAFTPDGRTLAAAGGFGNSQATLWDVGTRMKIGVLPVPGSSIQSLATSRDGKVLAANTSGGVVYLWSVATRHLLRILGGPRTSISTTVAFSPHANTLATGENNDQVYLWDPATGHRTGALTGVGDALITSVAFSPDGAHIAASDQNGRTYVWDTATRSRVAILADPHSFGVDSVAFSPDGRMLATGDSNSKTYLWKLPGKTLTATLTNPGGPVTSLLTGESRTAVFSVAFSPDGKTLATSDTNGSAYLWRVR